MSSMVTEVEQIEFEVVSQFAEQENADELLYSPLGQEAYVRRSRLYQIEYQGDATLLREFVNTVLVDDIAQKLYQSPQKPFQGWRFLLQKSMKAGTLDLEKEAILAYDRQANYEGFRILNLTLAQRFYVFALKEVQSDAFMRDLVNEAIEKAEVILPA